MNQKVLQPMIKRFWYTWTIRFWYTWTIRFWYTWSKGFDTHVPKVLIHMNHKVLCKRGASPPTCRDVCYHRYSEMSGALSYWLRAHPSVKGRHLSKVFRKFSLLCFYKKVFATHQLFYFRFFIFIWTSIFIYSFFERMVLIKGVRKGAEGPQWTKCFDKSLFFVFIKRFCNPSTILF